MTRPAAVDPLPLLLAEADPVALSRTVMAVAAMHEPDATGRCPWCTRHRPAGWRRGRRATVQCQTRRVIVAELSTAASPHWAPA